MRHPQRSRSAKTFGGFLLGLLLIASSCLATTYISGPCARLLTSNIGVTLPPADIMFGVVIMISILVGWPALLAALSFSLSVVVFGFATSGGVPAGLFSEVVMMTSACLASLLILTWTDIADLARHFHLDGELAFLVAMFASGITVGIGGFLVPDIGDWDPVADFAGDMAGVFLLFLTGILVLKASRAFPPACLRLHPRR